MGIICPSIFTLIAEFDVKNRSEALRSTMSLNNGRVLSTIGAASPPDLSASTVSASFSFTAGISALLYRSLSERAPLLFFVDDGECAAVVQILHLALALELDLEPQLVLGVGVAQCVFVGNEPRFVQGVQRLVECIHADARRARHDFLDFLDLAF